MKKKTKKIIKLVIVEILAIMVCAIAIVFKYYTNNIFFPDIRLLVILSIIGLIILGAGIWLEKL